MDILATVRVRLLSKITDMDRLARPSPPGDLHMFADDERKLGFTLPPLLKRLYSEIGNGGFGPGYGLTGLTNGFRDDTESTAPALYEGFRNDDELIWPDALIPICHWGCAIRSCIDCADPNFRMQIFDPNVREGEGWSECFFDDWASFEGWIEAWATGSDLWGRAYGDGGHVTKILIARHPELA